MKQLFSDILGFIKSLNQLDLLLYVAIVILIILVVSLIYIIKTSEEEEEATTLFNNEDIDLKEIVTTIENAEPKTVEFTSYEEEQEEKAIISYDELIKKKQAGTINYDKEELINNEVSIKKINLNSLTTTDTKNETDKTNSLFNFEKEEAFLETLKALNELLN